MKILTAAICVLSVGILSAGVERTASAQEWGHSYYRYSDDGYYRDHGRRHYRERDYRNHHRDDRRSNHRHERRDNSKRNNAWIQKFR